MKILAICIALLTAVITCCRGQQVVQRQFKTEIYTNGTFKTLWGQLYIPAVVDKNTITIVFFHGTGEVGASAASATWAPADYTKLTTWGIPYYIAHNWKPNYICLSLQTTSYSPRQDEAWTAITRDTFLSQVVDTNRLVITGLSAGGERCTDWMAKHPTSKYVYIAMSPAGSVGTVGLPIPNLFKTWSFCGLQDNSNYLNNAKAIASQTTGDVAKIGPGRFTGYTGGHGDWNTYYNPARVDTLYKEDLYTWVNRQFSSTPIPPIPPIKPPLKPGDQIGTIIYRSDTLWELNIDTAHVHIIYKP